MEDTNVELRAMLSTIAQLLDMLWTQRKTQGFTNPNQVFIDYVDKMIKDALVMAEEGSETQASETGPFSNSFV